MNERIHRTSDRTLGAYLRVEHVEHAELPRGMACGDQWARTRPQEGPMPPGEPPMTNAELSANLLPWLGRQSGFRRILPQSPSDDTTDPPFGSWTGAAPGRGRPQKRAPRLPFEILTCAGAPMLALVDGLRGAAHTLEGDFVPWVRGTGALVAFLGSGFAALQVIGAEGEYLIELEPPIPGEKAGMATVFRVVREVPASLAALAQREPPKAPRVEDGVALRLLGDVPCEPWLHGAVERLAASSSAVDRIASVGLLARLFRKTPTPRDPYAEGLEGPAARVREWARTTLRDDALRSSVESTAALRAEALIDLLERLEAAASDNADTAAITRQILHGRDDLESVAYVLEAAAARRGPLLDALDALDRQAEFHLSELSTVDDERLRAVSWQEAGAWWGAIAAQGGV